MESEERSNIPGLRSEPGPGEDISSKLPERFWRCAPERVQTQGPSLFTATWSDDLGEFSMEGLSVSQVTALCRQDSAPQSATQLGKTQEPGAG